MKKNTIAWPLVLTSCLFLNSCSLTPEPELSKNDRVAAKPSVANSTIYWVTFFIYVDAPWHQPPTWMYGQGTVVPYNPANSPGDTSAPSQYSPAWQQASISEPLPGEDVNLLSSFQYATTGDVLYIHSINASLNGQLPSDPNSSTTVYRDFKIVRIVPTGGNYPNITFQITYDVDVLGTGPGGPLIDQEPRRTVTGTIDLSTGVGTYQ